MILLLPALCGIVSVLEHCLLPDNGMNQNPNTYPVFLILLIAACIVYRAAAGFRLHARLNFNRQFTDASDHIRNGPA